MKWPTLGSSPTPCFKCKDTDPSGSVANNPSTSSRSFTKLRSCSSRKLRNRNKAAPPAYNAKRLESARTYHSVKRERTCRGQNLMIPAIRSPRLARCGSIWCRIHHRPCGESSPCEHRSRLLMASRATPQSITPDRACHAIPSLPDVEPSRQAAHIRDGSNQDLYRTWILGGQSRRPLNR